MIKFGYVGINTALSTPNRTFRLYNYTTEKMLAYTAKNLEALKNILFWNERNSIKVFRITSNLVPFGSSPINSGEWKRELVEDFREIGRYIKREQMKVSMHPGQYTVINTPNEIFYKNALLDLKYHNSILELMKLDFSHRIVIHGGGIYGAREESKKRLIKRIMDLPFEIRSRIALENDDRSFCAEEILELALFLHIPAVFDVFHHHLLPSLQGLSDREVIVKFATTWPDGERQEIHYSNQEPGKRRGSHSETIDISELAIFYSQVKDMELDIILEVKDKEQSVLKAITLVN